MLILLAGQPIFLSCARLRPTVTHILCAQVECTFKTYHRLSFLLLHFALDFSTSVKMVYHPIIDSVAVALICVLTIGFTRSSSLHRIVSLIVSSILTWHCLVSCPVYIHRNSWATSVGGYTLSALFHYLDVGVLSGWAYDLQGPARDLSSSSQQRPARPKETGTRASGVPADHDHIHIILSRLKFGAWVFTSWRFVNTPYQVRNIPPLKDYLRQDRIAFLLHTGVTFMACYLILDGLHASQDPALAAKFFSVDKTGLFSRFDQVTAEEFVMRFFTAVALGASLVSVQRGVYCLMAFVCVLFKASDPSEWPPFNGSVLEIYCLRTFWRYALPETISTIPFQVDYLARLNDSPSSFWHQINTHRLLVGANFLLYNVLRVPPSWKGSVPIRYTRACLVFLISGLLHVAIDVSAGE